MLRQAAGRLLCARDRLLQFIAKPADLQDLRYEPADLPLIVWLELTSKCPLECVFCTRKRLNGPGRHMAPELMRAVLEQLKWLERIYFNHSGESIHYPELGEAIRIAKRIGAKTELVSTLVSASPGAIRTLLEAGLDHLRVSLHTMDAGAFPAIYGFGSIDRMKARIDDFLELKQKLNAATTLEFSFVSTARNVEGLAQVARYAESVGVPVISVLSVTVRDGHPLGFEEEVEGGRLREGFRARIHQAIGASREQHPGVELQAVSPDIAGNQQLDAVPRFYPGTLPPGARIHTCFENPWDTMHILAGGEVMACGEHRRAPLGDLSKERLREVWHSPAYAEYRRRFEDASEPLCGPCPCKVAYLPAPLEPTVSARADSAQFLRGWYALETSGVRWSRREAVLALLRPSGGEILRLEGILPAHPSGEANHLTVDAGGVALAGLGNRSAQPMHFDLRVPLPRRLGNPVYLRLSTSSVFCPYERGGARDLRTLGFALISAEIRRR